MSKKKTRGGKCRYKEKPSENRNHLVGRLRLGMSPSLRFTAEGGKKDRSATVGWVAKLAQSPLKTRSREGRSRGLRRLQQPKNNELALFGKCPAKLKHIYFGIFR